ncbi:LysR family transcriptional regulator [Jannaschia aquimarina]|uniref:DmlR_2 protein n=1 Tax=Jannaschia aquimarina TaxID=935700 RepID=A0A0D1DAC1_9RHOB|nr:LysR family transcriptional regulator [Jannaschia aquimarina]KIT16838.1 HTH-type transcriptional regulator DmlR [Jannaschia aquimarina]SNT13248.1 DNA-binding transcriptional regulator, LysR family [Jannaschia aquimarina]
MPDRLDRLSAFLRVAERGSLTAAARDLGVSQPTVTRAIDGLEADLGASLLHRTTHSIALTEAGRMLVPRARRMLAAWEGLAEDLSESEALSGPLHVVAPIALGQTALVPVLARFRTENLGVTLNWQLNDEAIRMDEVGCDLWIRVGPVPDDRLVVRHVGDVHRSVLGHPRFAGRPLEACPWITLGPFEGRRIPLDGRMLEVKPVLNTNSVAVVGRALTEGVGVAIAPDWYMEDALGSGRVVRLDTLDRALPVHLAWSPERRTRRLAALVEAVDAGLRGTVTSQSP